MLINMAPAKTGDRQNFTVILDQDEMATLVASLQRDPLKAMRTTQFIDRINDLWQAHNGVPIVEPLAEQKLLTHQPEDR